VATAKKAKNVALVAGTQENLSNLFLIKVSMVLTLKYITPVAHPIKIFGSS
jgi:hypothetical protein